MGMKVGLNCVHIKDSRSLVGLRDRVISIVCELSASDNMSPENTDLVSGLHVDDLGGHRGAESGVAGHVLVVHILDRVV